MRTAILNRPGADDSLWAGTAMPGADHAALEGEANVDVAVIGGGFTGVRTALGLAEAGVEVALLDAHRIGWGASGRNGGQCNPMWRATPAELGETLGGAAAERLVAATLGVADDLFADIRRHDIDCDAVQAGWVQAAHDAESARDLKRLHDAWREAGARIEPLDAVEVASMTGSCGYASGLFHETGGQVQPLSMVRGFARAAVVAGARLHDHSPVTGLERTSTDGRARWRVRTPGGALLAERVVLATNAYTGDLHAGVARTLLPMVSIVVATPPLDPAAGVLAGGVTLSDTRRDVLYGRCDRDGRLAFGCTGSTEDPAFLGGLARLRAGLERHFPQLRGVEFTHRWGGRIGMTEDLLPHLSEPAPGLFAAVGYNGRGVASTSLMARTVVRHLLGADATELAFPVTAPRAIPLHAFLRAALPLAPPLLALRDRLGRGRPGAAKSKAANKAATSKAAESKAEASQAGAPDAEASTSTGPRALASKLPPPRLTRRQAAARERASSASQRP